MEEQIQEQSGETIITPPMIDSFGKKLLFGAFVIVAPIFNFSFIELLKPEWQNGRFSSYINLFLLPEASVWFFPLLAYAVGSYILLLWDTDRYVRAFIVRLGIYTGTFLALQYSLLTILALEAGSFVVVILAFLSPLILSRIYRWATAKWEIKLVQRLLIGFVIVATISSMILGRTLMAPFFFAAMILGVSAPFWSFLIALQAARWVWTHHESKLTLPRRLGIFGWLSAYAFALRFNILKMFELYNALPTEPPDCYIATAAAKGHPRFVGSRTVQLANGQSMQVNRQLQRLKAVEIAMMGASRTGHRMMRRMYDVIGKRLAARIQHPLLADVAHLILIPVEFVLFFVLKLIVPEIKNVAERFYLL